VAAAEDKVKGKTSTRYRAISTYAGRRVGRYVYTNYVNGIRSEGTNTNTYSKAGTQVTTSEGHPFLSSKEKGRRDLGGNFFTQKKFMIKPLTANITNRYRNTINKTDLVYTYVGPLLAVNPANTPYPPSMSSSNTELDAAGTTAIARIKPTNPVAGLTAALLELRREGLPSLSSSQTWESRATVARDAGGDYLNAQFGWKPLINDVLGFTSGVSHADAVIKQYRRGIGRPSRRIFNFPTTTIADTDKVYDFGTPWGPAESAFLDGVYNQGVISFERSIVQKRWFKGAFTYYFPAEILGSKKMADYAILAHQLGLYPSPEVLWQVTPWSWAVDWVSNCGDVISNWSSFHEDGLVMLYGYLMEHTIVTDTYSMSGFTVNGVRHPVQDVVLVTETKLRRGATPYGFGVNLGGLSAFRTSIMAALGLNKGIR